MSSPGRLLSTLRRDFRRGLAGSRHFYRTLRKIDGWKSPFWVEKPQEVPVHVLTGKEDWRLAAWMLASWFYFSEHSWKVVVHDDGSLPAEARKVLEGMFPQLRIISRAESDDEMETWLKEFPFCYEYRALSPLALKLFDTALFAKRERYILFDSDLLFFNYPRDILEWQSGKTEGCWFAADPAERCLLSPREAEEEMSVKLWSRVNTGLCLIEKGTVDPDFCDRALAQTTMLRSRERVSDVEQALYTLCASRGGKGGLLSTEYEVSKAKNAHPDTVARHYTGTSRDRFYAEGLPRLELVLLSSEKE